MLEAPTEKRPRGRRRSTAVVPQLSKTGTSKTIDSVECFVIQGVATESSRRAFGPIQVVLHEENGRGSLIVACWGLSWHGQWGFLNGVPLRKVIASTPADEIAEQMVNARTRFHSGPRALKAEKDYLTEILLAVAAHILRVEAQQTGQHQTAPSKMHQNLVHVVKAAIETLEKDGDEFGVAAELRVAITSSVKAQR